MFNSNDLAFHFQKLPPPPKKRWWLQFVGKLDHFLVLPPFSGCKEPLETTTYRKTRGFSQPPASPPKNAPCTLGFSETLQGVSVEKSITTFRLRHNEVFYAPSKRRWAWHTTILSRAKSCKHTLQSMMQAWIDSEKLGKTNGILSHD